MKGKTEFETEKIISGSSAILDEFDPIIYAPSRIKVVSEKVFSPTEMIFDATVTIFFVAQKIFFVTEKIFSDTLPGWEIQRPAGWCLSSGGKSDSSYPAHPIKREHQPL